MYVARAQTQQYTGNIQGGEGGQRRKMPYWFSVLEDLINGNSDGV